MLRLAAISSEGALELALVRDDALYPVRRAVPLEARALWDPRLFYADPLRSASVVEKLADDIASGEPEFSLNRVLAPPVPYPSKIIGLGRNYAMHAVEMGGRPLREPDVFLKAPSALIGHGDTIIIPRFVEKPDYEGEIVLIVGRRLKEASRSEAKEAILGFTAGIDVTARDIQYGERRRPWSMAKSLDTFAPLGPYVSIIDSYSELEEICLETRLNARLMQHGCVGDMLFEPDEIVSYLSRLMTLYPGDLIYTGTPPGVGHARTPPVYLLDGDVLEVRLSSEHPLRLSVRRRQAST